MEIALTIDYVWLALNHVLYVRDQSLTAVQKNKIYLKPEWLIRLPKNS